MCPTVDRPNGSPQSWTEMVVPLSLALLCSCIAAGDEGGIRDATVRTDSAGVEIITSLRPLWSEAQAWRISAEPELQIGRADGAADDVLHGVTAIRHLGESILVAQATELRFYNQDGAFLGRLGGAGRGPGEFFRIADALPCNDWVYASELSPPQLIVFEASGQSTTLPLPAAETQGFLSPLAPLLECTRLGVIGGMSGPQQEGGSLPGVQRRSGLIVHLRRDGTGVDTLISFQGPETYSGLRVPFGRNTLVGAKDTLLYLAETGDPEFRVFGHDGSLRRIVRVALPVREVTPEDVERIRSQYLAGLPPSMVAEIRPRLDAVSVPATMPYFSELKVSTNGTVWLQYYQAFRDEEVTGWAVVDPTGVWLGDVALPSSFAVHQFHANHVIGVWRDELDVEFVRQYSIRSQP